MQTDNSAGATATAAAATLDDIRSTVQARYGAVASSITQGATSASCCGPAAGAVACCGSANATRDPITADLYDSLEAGQVPETALLASLGCAVASNQPKPNASRACGCDDGCCR